MSLGWFRPLRDQRLQEPALSGFRFEPNTRGEFRAWSAEIVAPAVDAIGILLELRGQQGQCAPAIVMRLECLRIERHPHCCCRSLELGHTSTPRPRR